MATAVGLSFQLTASSVGMSQGVNDAAKQLGRLGTSAQKAAADLGVLKTIEIGRAFLSGIERIGTSFASYVNNIASSVEATSNLSRELGISFEQLTQLQLAAQLSGASAEDLARAFTKAQVTIAKAANGGKEATQALASIGLSAGDFQGLTSSEQFTLIANAINGIADPAQRAAAAVAIFGKSGAALLPVFRELGGNLEQAQELLAKFNGGVSEEQAARVNAIGDAFDQVGAAINIVATQALAALQPALTQATSEFINFLAALDITAIAQTVSSVIEGLGNALTFAYSVASLLGPAFTVIQEALAFLGENAQGAAIGLGVAVGALVAYEVFTKAAAIATGGFGKAVRALLASSGIGLLATVVGTVGGALLEWGISASTASGQAGSSVDQIKAKVAEAASSARQASDAASAAIRDSFSSASDQAKKAADDSRRAADAARREADQAIQRVTVEQQFGGDSQRYAAAQAVEAIQADILRTEQEIAAARQSGDQDAIDAGAKRLGQLDQALARERDIASGARKAAEERLKLEADYARAREAFDQRRLAALAKPSTELLQLEDVRTASGFAALQRFSQDQTADPALEEYRKQLKELIQIRKALEGTEDVDETVDILGA